MRKLQWRFGLTRAVLTAVTLLVLLPVSVFADEIEWHNAYEPALARAREANKPLLIDFWAEWCGPCRVMDEQLWTTETVTALADEYVYLRVDVDEDRDTTHKYRVGPIPTMLIADSLGTELVRTEGFSGPEPYARLIEIVHDAYPEIARWSERLASDPQHTEALHQIGRAFYAGGVYTVSNDYYQRALKSPGAKEDRTTRIEILTAIGWNELFFAGMEEDEDEALRSYGKALRTFKKSLRLDPAYERRDVALFGLVMCHGKRREFKDAERCLRELETEFPNSPATARALRFLRQE